MPAPPERITAQQYLERERLAETKSEYHDGRVYAMPGAFPDHVLINSNVSSTLSGQLRDRPCRVYSSDLRVSIESGRRYVYPDVIVTCGEERLEEFDILANPVVVVEVLSPSTEAYDRGTKFDAYWKIESLREYVLVSTLTRRVEVFRRNDEGGWGFESCPLLPSPLALRSIGCKLDLGEVYFKTDVPDELPDDAHPPDGR